MFTLRNIVITHLNFCCRDFEGGHRQRRTKPAVLPRHDNNEESDWPNGECDRVTELATAEEEPEASMFAE